MMSTEKTILTLAVGMAIGAGLGLLFAPQGGADTRKRIRKEFDRCCDRFEDLTDELTDLFEEGKEKLAEVVAHRKGCECKSEKDGGVAEGASSFQGYEVS